MGVTYAKILATELSYFLQSLKSCINPTAKPNSPPVSVKHKYILKTGNLKD